MLEFTTPEATTGFDLLDLFRTRGFVAFREPDGGAVLFIHAQEDGNIPGLERVMGYLPVVPDDVVCCFPQAARRRNPGLPIVGDWAGETSMEAFMGFIEVSG